MSDDNPGALEVRVVPLDGNVAVTIIDHEANGARHEMQAVIESRKLEALGLAMLRAAYGRTHQRILVYKMPPPKVAA